MRLEFKEISFIVFLVLSCGTETAGHDSERIDKTRNKAFSKDISGETIAHIYQDSMPCQQFFETLITVHGNWFLEQADAGYASLCSANDLLETDSLNRYNFVALSLIHELLSSRSASNCSKGEILDIPYYWHWVKPNPRHEIRFVSDGKLLSESKPPSGFGKYRSYADIDRTPYLFISDMLSGDKKYYSDNCDTFSGFGWCSEREMASVALLNILGIKGKVVAENNHSWSEYIVEMKMNNGKYAAFRVKVDNTFYAITWFPISNDEIKIWTADLGRSALAKWYNSKANSATELEKIRKIIVSSATSADIERRILRFKNL